MGLAEMNAFTRPILVGANERPTLLERIPLTGGNELCFDERSLQDLLFQFPESIPVRDIDPHIGPLVPVCSELETGAGPADILYVTPSGQLVLAETKLWRNPEARREVVAQILDYAKQLTTWNYDLLDEAASLAAKKASGHLLRCLADRFPDANEASFVDGIGRSLKSGDFLLLIIGDGIRYGAESLISFLEKYGNLRFSLSLVEVAAFRLPGGQMLLQPRILAKTETLQKTLLIGPSGPVTFQEVAQAEDEAQTTGGQRSWFVAFWRGFLEKLKLPDRSLMPSEAAKSTNQYFPMPPGGSSAWISAYIAQSSGRAGVYLTFARSYPAGLQIYEELLADRSQIEADFGGSLNWEKSGDKVFVSVPATTFKDLNEVGERDRVTSYLAEKTARLIFVLHPRLAAMTRATQNSQ